MSSITIDDLIESWQQLIREPGELVGIWNHELDREDIGMVLLEENNMKHVKLKPKYDYSKVHVMISGRVEKLSKWEVFPVGRATASPDF